MSEKLPLIIRRTPNLLNLNKIQQIHFILSDIIQNSEDIDCFNYYRCIELLDYIRKYENNKCEYLNPGVEIISEIKTLILFFSNMKGSTTQIDLDGMVVGNSTISCEEWKREVLQVLELL